MPPPRKGNKKSSVTSVTKAPAKDAHQYPTRSKRAKAPSPSPAPSSSSASSSSSAPDDDDESIGESDSDTETESESETEPEDEPELEESDVNGQVPDAEYMHFLASLFPSSYMTARANEVANQSNSNVLQRKTKRKADDDFEDETRGSKVIKSMLSSIFAGDNSPAAVCIRIMEGQDQEPEPHEQETSTPPTPSMSAEQLSQNVTGVLDAIPSRDRKLPAVQKIIDHIQACIAESVPTHMDASPQEPPSLLTDDQLRQKHVARYRGLLQEKPFGDLQYFADKLTLEEQKEALAQMQELKTYNEVKKPYGLLLLDSKIPLHYKAVAMRKIRTLRLMEPGAGEYFKLKNWVDAFMRMPFGVYKSLPVTYQAGASIDACQTFMTNAKQTLDNAVFGLEDAKMQIMQMIGQWLVNPDAVGTAIAIKGPMGTGKTTLVKEGISKILGRDFAFIALGGATDSSFLEGHSYTYEGSKWGYIVDILLKCQSMNPVIYFDELDKVSNTPKGEEIIGILTHLTDTSQNSCFHDRYFTDIDFDLSRCLFIFSYNDESKVNPILLDRMYRIHTKGYSVTDKQTIARQHLMPTIRQQLRFTSDDITVPDETVDFVVKHLTQSEDGVRNLKRCLEIIHSKLNLLRFTDPTAFFKDLKQPLTFPIVVTPALAEQLIKRDEQDTGAWRHMYS
jgi:hypothetical protein